MKEKVLFLFALCAYSCSSTHKVNEKIYNSQSEAILESPYRDAATARTFLEAQKSYRFANLSKLCKELGTAKSCPQDTVVIHEAFDAICIGCPSFLMQVYYKDSIYSFYREVLGHQGGERVSFDKVPFYANYLNMDYEAKYGEIVEIVNKLRVTSAWRNDPLQFGLDSCLDGSHSLMTTIFPDGKTEALYIRCWMPKSSRRQK